VREKFESHYIFSDTQNHQDMYAKLMESGWVEKVYEDDEAFVLKIRDEKGEPPKEAEAAADNSDEPTPEEIKAAEAEENDGNLLEPDDDNSPGEANNAGEKNN